MGTPAPTVILAPTDMSDASLQAVVYAAGLARRLGTHLVLFHVASQNEMDKGLAQGEYVDQRIEDVREELAWWFRKAIPPDVREGVQVETVVRIGRPGEEILAEAEYLSGGVIVMATHGRTGLSRALLGSVAEEVVRHAPCPVLTIRTRAPVGAEVAAQEAEQPHPR
jgi:universal stress protein A